MQAGRGAAAADGPGAPSDPLAIVGDFVEVVMNVDLREISPELVLVDPELAPLARLLLSEPASFGMPAAAPVEARAGKRMLAHVRRTSVKHRELSKPLLLLVAASLTLNGVFIRHAESSVARPTLAVTPTAAGPTVVQHRENVTARHEPSRRTATPAAKSMPDVRRRQASPARTTLHRSGPAVRTRHGAARSAAADGGVAQTIHWKEVPNATYYDVVLWRDGKRLLDVWPTSARALLPRNMSPRGGLSPGRYLWFIYPGFDAKALQHYGALAGSGVFVIEAKGG
jgi:hypothetical protein